MADHSKVNIDALGNYGMKIGASPAGKSALSDFENGTGGPVGNIASARVGMVNTNEAKVFRDWYRDGISDALSQLVKDSTTGLMALGGSAIVMAANYKAGDLAQEKAMNEVFEMFNQSPGKSSLDYNLAHDNQLAGKTKVKNVERLGKHPPSSMQHTHDESPADRATDQQKHHRDTYGKDEKWRPAGGKGTTGG